MESTLSYTSQAHRLEALVRSTFRLVNHLTRPAVEATGLTLPRLWVLTHIDGSPGITMSQLARRMTMSRSALTALVDELVRAGLVRRDADPADRRVIRLFATPEGQRKMNDALDVRVALIDEVLETLPPDEIDGVLTGLEHLATQLRNRAVSSAPG